MTLTRSRAVGGRSEPGGEMKGLAVIGVIDALDVLHGPVIVAEDDIFESNVVARRLRLRVPELETASNR